MHHILPKGHVQYRGGPHIRGLLLLLLALFSSFPAAAQVRYTTFEKLDSAMQTAPRKTFVLIRTSWCAYCNMMEHTTLQNKPVVQLLNNCFYSISLDAEQKREIHFKGKVYAFQPRGNNSGQNQLANVLMKGDAVIYPSIVLLDEHYRIIFRTSGYIDSKQLLHLLQRACAGEKDISRQKGTDSLD
ncbi:thioredoxin family protein [Chitinophaga agrisoli]|uniref:Thioredoxin family protein n=1 Tax=Chitinophaga agrisoli TaxID=2607653 RepID=A0A5B2W0A6_9BACT|nr:thioredoxin fold domain-containing protein [Chitinophaga agrisoli]KAA2244765.1 thioredoxin family protein [Chitinophaga agrisoli]